MAPRPRSAALGGAVLALCGLTAAGENILENLANALKETAAEASLAADGDGGRENPLGDLMGLLGAVKDHPDGSSVCKKGKMPAPKMDHHEQMSANGCGPQGFQIKEAYGLHKCCNGHDVCFSVCGTSHEFCEKEFSRCMKKICKTPLEGSPKECKQQAKAFSKLTKTLGKAFHSKSQEMSCDCLKGSDVPARHRAFLQNFFSRYNESQATDEVLDDTLERWKGREAHLYFDLVKTYGKHFVRFDDIEAEFHNDEL